MLPLIEHATQYATRLAISSDGHEYTYEQLVHTSTSIASNLLGQDSDLDEARIAFMVNPSFEYVATQWGIWQAGGIAVPLCVLHPLPSLRYVLVDTQAEVLIVGSEYLKMLAPLTEELDIKLFTFTQISSEDSGKSLPDIPFERRAMILYTSGTTSKPKGVVTTHANISFQIQTLVKAWEWQPEDRILNILPLHHVHGIINVMSCALWVGACCEFLPKFEAAKVWEKFVEGKLNLFMAVPTIYFKLIAYWESVDPSVQRSFSKSCAGFRLMVSGSAALPVSVLEKWEAISGHTLLERYGMTEIGMALSNPYIGERRAGHVGLPLPGVQIRLVDEKEREVKAGAQGEIQIKSLGVFKEYWQKAAATQEAFTKGAWFKTGDIAIVHKGYYKILGRNSVDIIKSGGYKISALEIEEVLRTYPFIQECAVVGIPDDEWGEIVAASLVCDGDIDTDQLKVWLKNKLPAYKLPRRFIFQDDLPRNTLGKVTKKELKNHFL